VCRCSSKTRILATTFYVPPITIDFYTVFAKFEVNNVAVYGTIIALLSLYILLAIGLFRKDKQDKVRVS